MDETHQSRVSDAAATRKRRSSILKSQRPPRTPFSELEFNVATPTDTAKSRRVSFSRRTGIAEFVTNEATTTWKNFYEEHNKSLESSGNESGAKSAASIGHIGQTMFDRQFQEVEAVDFITSLDNLACRNISTSLNNFTEQLASLEGISDDRKLTAPQNQFELSALTEHQNKFFGDDLSIPVMGEMSGRINVNFSAVQNIGGDIVDDLDEIQKDLKTVQSNIVGPSSFRNDRDLSEYIEVELNSTHVGIRVEESDMSITETIPSPKVQNVSRSNISTDTKASFINDLDLDKENKCIPDIKMKSYVEEMDDLNADMSITSVIPTNIAGNVMNKSESRPAIVFDKNSEKRKTIIFDDELGNLSMTKAFPTKLLPIQSDVIKSNAYDANRSVSGNVMNESESRETRVFDKNTEKRKTIIFDDELGNLSMTKALPATLLPIISDVIKANAYDANRSVSGKLRNEPESRETIECDKNSEKRKTIIFDDELGNLSMTKALPTTLLPIQSDVIKSNIYDADRTVFNRSIIQSSPTLPKDNIENLPNNSHKIEELSVADIDQDPIVRDVKMNFCVEEMDDLNADMTSAIPTNIAGNLMNEPESRVFDKKSEKRKTIIFDDELGNLSMTEAIPASVLSIQSDFINRHESDRALFKRSIFKSSELLMDNIENLPNYTHKFEEMEVSVSDINEDPKIRDIKIEEIDNLNADMSITSAIPTNIAGNLNNEPESKETIVFNKNSEKRKTIIFDDELGNLSMTKALPTKLLPIQSDLLKSNAYDANRSVSGNLESRETTVFNQNSEKRKTIIFDDELGNLSMTKALPATLLPIQSDLLKSNTYDANRSVEGNLMNEPELKESTVFNKNSEKRKTIIFDDELGNLSMTEAIPASVLPIQSDLPKSNAYDANRSTFKTSIIQSSTLSMDNIENLPNNTDKFEEMELSVADIDEVPKVRDVKMKSYVEEMDDLSIDMSMTSAISTNIARNLMNVPESRETIVFDKNSEKRKTIIFDDELGNLSMTKVLPATLLPIQSEVIKSNAYDANRSTFKRSIIQSSPTLPMDNIENLTNNTDKIEEIKVSVADINEDPEVRDQVSSNNISGVANISVTPDYKKTKAIPMMGEMSGRINAVQNLGLDIVDDLDELQKDLQTVRSNITGPSSFRNDRDLLGCEEVELNSTHVGLRVEESGMHITETIPSHKVQNVSSTNISTVTKASFIKDLEFDKENKCIPDVKMKSYVEEMGDLNADMSVTSAYATNIAGNLKNEPESKEESTVFDKNSEKRKTIVFDNELGNLSMAQALPAKLLPIQSDVIKSDAYDANRSTFKTSIIQSSPTMHMDNKVNLSNTTDKIEEMEVSLADIDEDPEVRYEVNSNNITNISVTPDHTNSKASDEGNALMTERQDEDHKSITVNLSEQENSKTDEKKFNKEVDDISMNKPTGLLSIASQIDDLCNADILTVMESENKDNSELKRISVATYIKHNVSTNVSIREPFEKKDVVEGSGKRKTITFEDDLSIAKSIKSTLVFIENEDTNLPQGNNSVSESVTSHANKSVVLRKVVTEESSEVKIPPHLKNVSEEIKSLMNDLVKPMADVMPFGSALDENLKKTSSTCNTEIQASLVTSSQIDLTNELDKNSEMFTVFDERRSLISSKNEIDYESDSIKNEINLHHCPSDNLSQVDLFNVKEISFRPQRTIPENTVSGGELIFDYNNPLNNVLLVPLHSTDAHKYNPKKSNDSVCVSEHSNSVQCVMKETEVQKVSVHYIDNENTGDVSQGKIPDTQSFLSNVSKPGSIDQSIDAKLPEVRDTEVNTLIVMKGNTELLQASSSLTLVDDAIANSMIDVEVDTQPTNSQVALSENTKVISPVKVIYKMNSENTYNQNDSDMTSTSNDEDMNVHNDTSKSKKRNYSPTKQDMCKDSSESRLDLTPKPISKMQKISNSPNTLKNIVHCNKKNDLSKFDGVRDMDLDDIEINKSPRKCKGLKKPGTSITVQQLLTEYNIDPNIDQKLLNEKILEALNHSVNSTVSEIDSSMSRLSECESSLNVVAKIDMLPFMGSHDCEWESSGMDSWSFRVLHARLRLHVRLTHCHHNAARTRVRADTPVRQVAVQRVHRNNEDKSSVAGVCVGFAAEAIERLAASCSRAGDVPALLQAAAAAARQARRWGRAMHRARAHLAYRLTDQGLTLNVANIPLRCVWEVHMKLEMVFEPASGVPWPRATDVRAKNVLAAETVPDAELRRALARVPAGWGHVPATVWRIFKYLKNKTRDDEFLGI